MMVVVYNNIMWDHCSCKVGWGTGRLWEWPLVMVVIYNSIMWDNCSCIVGWGRQLALHKYMNDHIFEGYNCACN